MKTHLNRKIDITPKSLFIMFIVELLANSQDVEEYVRESGVEDPRFLDRLEGYRLDPQVAARLRCYRDSHLVVAFNAEWCPDCMRQIPVLALVQRETGLKARVFGHLMRDAKNAKRRWSIPPSPPQVEDFEVERIPPIFVLDKEGAVLGSVVENPPARIDPGGVLTRNLGAS